MTNNLAFISLLTMLQLWIFLPHLVRTVWAVSLDDIPLTAPWTPPSEATEQLNKQQPPVILQALPPPVTHGSWLCGFTACWEEIGYFKPFSASLANHLNLHWKKQVHSHRVRPTQVWSTRWGWNRSSSFDVFCNHLQYLNHLQNETRKGASVFENFNILC